MTSDRRPMRVPQLLVALTFLIVGSLGAIGAAVLTVPAWRAAHGGGVSGTFTLTEPMSCDRYPPPRQRCGWFGDFTSDGGTLTRQRMELSGGLPAGATVGETFRARDTGSLAQIYQDGDTQAWHTPALFLGAFLAAVLVGLVLLEPWQWRARRRSRQRSP